MVGPSANGSLNGTPSSITSAPASANAKTYCSVASSEGSPAVMYATMPSSPLSRSCAKRREMRVELAGVFVMQFVSCDMRQRLEQALIGVHVLVAAAGDVQDYQVVFAHFRNARLQSRKRMRRLQRRNNAFGARQQTSRLQRRIVRNRGVAGATLVRQPGVLRSDRGIVEPRADGMRGGNLSVFVLQHVSVRALQHAGARSGESLRGRKTHRVLAQSVAASAGFDAHHFHVTVAQKI